MPSWPGSGKQFHRRPDPLARLAAESGKSVASRARFRGVRPGPGAHKQGQPVCEVRFMTNEDLRVLEMSCPEPVFDEVMTEFLHNSRDEFLERCQRGGLIEYGNIGMRVPWLWRLTFLSRGLMRDETGDIHGVERHVVAVRFLPDYLRQVNQFQSIALLEPETAFHPNLAPPAICLHLYPGMPLVEIAEALHALFSWRLRQLAENDALNRDACAWGRAHLDELPLDNRPLLGRAMNIQLEEIA